MIYIAIIFIGFLLDRITKTLAVKNLIDNPRTGTLINLTYLENRGAAFGIMQDSRIFFIVLTLMIVGYLIYIFVKNYKTNPKLLNYSLALIIAGALGNFYDRLFQGYVVDFLEFAFINFPIFNVADIFVTVGCALMIIYLIFIDESEKAK